MDHSKPDFKWWKSAIIAATVLLVIAGLFIVIFNLPIVTGDVPQ